MRVIFCALFLENIFYSAFIEPTLQVYGSYLSCLTITTGLPRKAYGHIFYGFEIYVKCLKVTYTFALKTVISTSS